MTPTVPALVPASTIRKLLTDVGAHDIPSHYTVSAIGVYNHELGHVIECDTEPFYTACGVTFGEKIDLGDTEITVTRYIIVHNDLDE